METVINCYKWLEKVFDIALGSRDRAFESPHSDQNPSEIVDFRGIFLIFDYCGAEFEPLYAFSLYR